MMSKEHSPFHLDIRVHTSGALIQGLNNTFIELFKGLNAQLKAQGIRPTTSLEYLKRLEAPYDAATDAIDAAIKGPSTE